MPNVNPQVSVGPGFTAEDRPYAGPVVDVSDNPIDAQVRTMALDPNVLARNQAEVAATGLPAAQSGELRTTLEQIGSLAAFGSAIYAKTRRPDGSTGATGEAVRPAEDTRRNRRRGDRAMRGKSGKRSGMDTPSTEAEAMSGNTARGMTPLLLGLALAIVVYFMTKNVMTAAVAGIGAVVVLSLLV